jgi:Zn-finger nucleic acid-binding protein
MTDRNSVEIDYCPSCRGIWLDRGELDKIIERSASADRSAPKSGPAPDLYRDRDHHRHHDDHKHYDYKKKKKDSFLEDLFDF